MQSPPGINGSSPRHKSKFVQNGDMEESRSFSAGMANPRSFFADVAGSNGFYPPADRLLFICPLVTVLAVVNFFLFGGVAVKYGSFRTIRTDGVTSAEISSQVDNYGAICLTGSARDFELTGLSIEKYLLSPFFNNSDVFVNAVLDHTVHKLTVFRNLSNLVRLKVSSQIPISEGGAAKRVLDSHGSPRGIQGILQMFNLVEGCYEMIEEHQKLTNKKYHWVIRTRLDTFWNANPPPLEFVPSTYIVPEGSGFLGLNDRFGAGLKRESDSVLQRLTVLTKLDGFKLRKLNSERAFMSQLRITNISAVKIDLHFCILSRRGFPLPTTKWGLPTLSISGEGAANGAKCRPCKPALSEERSASILNSMARDFGWPGNSSKLLLCFDSENWDVEMYDELVGPEWASVRKSIINRTFTECENDYESFLENTRVTYKGPSPAVICQVAEWGSPEVIDSVPVFTKSVGEKGIVYSIAGKDKDDVFEKMVHDAVKRSVHMFQYSVPLQDTEPEGNQGLQFYSWESLTNSSREINGSENNSTEQKISPEKGYLKTTMENLSHKFIDLLIISTNSSSAQMPSLHWLDTSEDLPICQIIVRFTGTPIGLPFNKVVEQVTELLHRLGFYSVHCLGRYGLESCTFLRKDGCRNR